jgi:hypothetical protein
MAKKTKTPAHETLLRIVVKAKKPIPVSNAISALLDGKG